MLHLLENVACFQLLLSNLHGSLVRNLWAGGCPFALHSAPEHQTFAYICARSARNKIEQQAAEVDHNIRPKGLLSRSRCSASQLGYYFAERVHRGEHARLNQSDV